MTAPRAASWAFHEEDSDRIHGVLLRVPPRIVIADGAAGRSGRPDAGYRRRAADVRSDGVRVADGGGFFSANDQLARLLGESEFGTLFHQGERESLYLADIARRVILVVLFDNRTTLGLVKLRLRATVGDLSSIFTAMFARDTGTSGHVDAEFVGEAEDEMDKLFGS